MSRFSLHAEPQIERKFQRSYYVRIRPMLRVSSPLLAAMFLAYALRDFSETHASAITVIYGAPAAFFLLMFALTWVEGFDRLWQSVVAVFGLLALLISLNAAGSYMAGRPEQPAVHGKYSVDGLFFGGQMRLLMISMALMRLQFKWALTMQLCIVLAGTWVFSIWLFDTPPTGSDYAHFVQPSIAVFITILLAAWVEENLSRSAFRANLLLDAERTDEKRKREQSEKTLHVLAQAMGGIVHDLGNPLTTVQLGAETLDLVLDKPGPSDKKVLKGFTDDIISGAQMLNYLRLSLIEQARVLEGKATPVDLRPISLGGVVREGARFQKPYTLGHRSVHIEGDDIYIHGDEAKMVTVFMNLIGNSLKYSDGDIRVVWSECSISPESAEEIMQTGESPESSDIAEYDRRLLVAVMDGGTEGVGITREQAAQLFTPFGRLECHADIEGTGLGLLSVQKIVRAQGGEVFIEGYENGTPDSAPFSTAKGQYPSMLSDSARTALVVTCIPV